MGTEGPKTSAGEAVRIPQVKTADNHCPVESHYGLDARNKSFGHTSPHNEALETVRTGYLLII